MKSDRHCRRCFSKHIASSISFRYTGRKEPILDHSAYFIITQSPDGVFEAVPVQAWYNFMPDIDYATLSADQVEQEFSKRDRRMNAYQEKYGLRPPEEESSGSKVQRRADGSGLVCTFTIVQLNR